MQTSFLKQLVFCKFVFVVKPLFFLFPWQTMLSLDNIENVWDILCPKPFSRGHFLCSLAWSYIYESPAYKEKKHLQACLASCHFKPAAPASVWTSPGYVPVSVLLANYGHIYNFNLMISTLQIFSLHQVIKSKDWGIQKKQGFPKAHFEMILFSVFSSL